MKALDNLPTSQNIQDEQLDRFLDLVAARLEARATVKPQPLALKPYEYPPSQPDRLPLMIALGGVVTLIVVALINSIAGMSPSAAMIEQNRAIVKLAEQNNAPRCVGICLGGQ